MDDNKSIIRNMIIENIYKINSRLNKIRNEEFYNSKIIEVYNLINSFDENSISSINNVLKLVINEDILNNFKIIELIEYCSTLNKWLENNTSKELKKEEKSLLKILNKRSTNL